MGQSKLNSLIEAGANTLAGLVFAYIIQIILNHLYGIEMSNGVAAQYVFWFTIASVLRSYCIRRISNWVHLRKQVSSTKACPNCKCSHLGKLTSLNLKICPDCGMEIKWELEKGQKSLLTKTVGGKYDDKR